MSEAPAGYVRAVSRLADVAARASGTGPQPISDEAIDVLIETLHADRASVLLFDDAGVMRFTAWRNLSDAYRAAVDGHSPWTADTPDPQPVVVPDVCADTAVLGPLRETIAGEGIRALAFIPLRSGGRLLGKFMLYFDRPHAFTPAEIDLAQTIAAHVAFAIDKARLEDDLRTANVALGATLDAVTDGITVQAPDGSLLFANDEAAAMLGYASPAELLAAGPAAILRRFSVFDEGGHPIPLADLPGRQALLGQEPPERLIRWRTADSDERCSLVSARPVRGEDGRVKFAVNVFRDVTARQQAQQRVAFLATSSRRLLDTTLDYTTVLQRVADLFVPDLADACTVRELREDGSVERVVARHSDAIDAEVARRLAAYPDRLASQPLLDRLKAGESFRIAELPLEQVAGDPEELDLYRRLRLTSAIVAPLLARSRPVGIVTVAAADGRRPYDTEDLALVEEVARRAGLAVENARLFEERSTVASTLQRALLPPALPYVPGVELAARYRAADSDIGGDFYDVVPIDDRRWVMVVGDVCGKGIEAASLTAMVRYTLRAFAGSVERPSELLAKVNDVLLGQLDDERFCTVACGILDLSDDEPRLALSLGGHPRPLLVSADGQVKPVGRPGSLIGSLPTPLLVDDEVELAPGDALVVFTDGCQGGVPTAPDEDRLAEELRRHADTTAAELAEAVELAAAGNGQSHADDLTVLALRRGSLDLQA